jgi:hypothetical protein
VKDPGEVLLPDSDDVFVILRTEESRGHISFPLLDNLLLNLSHSPAIINIRTLASESLRERIASTTHIVSCSIASSTG